MTVIKRDGREVEFDKSRIYNAILKAFEEVDGEITPLAQSISDDISTKIEKTDKKQLSVERIQDIVEKKLMNSKRKDVAKAYILYRDKRSKIRNWNTEMMQLAGEKLSAKSIDNQNANVDEMSFGGRKGEADSVIFKQYALDNCMSEKSKYNHLNNRIYIHDLDSYAVGQHNCLSIPFDDLLANGFNTRQTDVRPANSVSTAFQLLAVIFQLQSLQQFGGVSATHLDWTMTPYVRKSFWKHFKNGLSYIELSLDTLFSVDEEKIYELLASDLSDKPIDSDIFKHFTHAYQYAMDMTVKEVGQAVEAMFHNLNTLQSRSGNQLPFTSINTGTCTLPEGRLITKAILEGCIKGVGKLHRTSVFPCVIFQCMKGVNRKEGDPNYDLFRLALKSTSLRLYPNYCNVDWSGNEGYDIDNPKTYFSTMGCRTANGWDINGFGQLKDGRGNICPVTIILPTIAMETKNIGDGMGLSYEGEDLQCRLDAFLDALDNAIFDSKDMLIERFKWICSQPPESAKFMYENGLMAGYNEEEGTISALKHGTLAIGQLGLAETLQILIGCDHTTDKGMELAKKIESLFKKRCAEFKEEYKLNFGVYYTPAENLCFTALKKFRNKYGVIPNVSDKEFFTNSMHIPVWKKLTPFEKIDLESQLTGYSSAGCITYVELQESVKHNLDGLEEIVNYAMDKDIPYFAINIPNDTCLECGYTDEINNVCPKCGSSKIQRLRRVTGYLTNDYKTAFNLGKQDEVERRIKHDEVSVFDEDK